MGQSAELNDSGQDCTGCLNILSWNVNSSIVDKFNVNNVIINY